MRDEVIAYRFSVAMGVMLAGPAMAADPYAKPDDSWISISGTVASPTADSFQLDYGDGLVMVEMDDWDSYGDAYGLMEGDEVVVYGKVDDDLYEATTIEAGSVYVEDLNTYFYASSDDEEDLTYWVVSEPLVLSRTSVRGTVTSVDAAEREFTIDIGARKLTVETEYLGYNAFDDVGFQKIEKGDRISASGAMDQDFLEGRVLDADSVITLSDADKKEGKGS